LIWLFLYFLPKKLTINTKKKQQKLPKTETSPAELIKTSQAFFPFIFFFIFQKKKKKNPWVLFFEFLFIFTKKTWGLWWGGKHPPAPASYNFACVLNLLFIILFRMFASSFFWFNCLHMLFVILFCFFLKKNKKIKK
jgi:hypothetical protein